MCFWRGDCLWADQCGMTDPDVCDDYTPVDLSEKDERFYDETLKENQEEYLEMIKDYSDGRDYES